MTDCISNKLDQIMKKLKNSGVVFLQTTSDYLEWKEDRTFDGDIAEWPIEFPCFVYKSVLNWNYQTEIAVYLYLSDIEYMLEKLGKEIQND